MNIIFYVLMTIAAIYAIFHITDFFKWWFDVMLIVPKAIWNFILKLFGKR